MPKKQPEKKKIASRFSSESLKHALKRKAEVVQEDEQQESSSEPEEVEDSSSESLEQQPEDSHERLNSESDEEESSEEEQPKKARQRKTSDRIDCKVCGKNIARSSQAAHNRSQNHKIYALANKKIKNLLLQ